YTHEGFKFLNLSTQILENKGKVLDKLLIFEGVKMPDFTHGGGGGGFPPLQNEKNRALEDE
ncbi:hypothetical protein, partial [Campylobacter helveticus]